MTTKNTLQAVTVPGFFSEEESSRLILHTIDETYILVHPGLEIVYCNRAAKENVPRFLHKKVHTGMNILELTPVALRPKLERIYAQVLQGQRFEKESRFTLDDGTETFFKIIFLPAYNEEEKISGIVIYARNITEKKKAQQIIQESEDRLEAALEAARQGVWDWDLETNEVFYSSSYKKLYGFGENELKNHVSEWITRVHPDDQVKIREMITEHLQSPEPVYDSQYRILGKDGRYRWVMAKGRLVNRNSDGKPLRMIGIHTDITEAMQREAELKQINERFDCMMKATHELLWEWDIVKNEIFRSEEAMRKVYGLQDDSSIRKIEQWLERIHPEDRMRLRQLLNDILNAPHQYTFEMEYRFERGNGEYAHIYDRGILIRNEKNEPVRVIGSAEDISERKRLEKELLNNQLEYQRLLHQATVESQEKERAEIGKELHDNVNQVLTTTKLYLDLALVSAELKEDLIRKSRNNINSVIQEIRQLSRSLMNPSIGDLGLADSVNDLVESIHLTRKLKIVHTIDASVDEVLNSNQKLAVFRILQESLNNVLRHAKATTVWVDICHKDGWGLITLHDDGIGFEPDSVRLGAGLKNIQNRIYLINGTLRVESSPKNGCTLHLQFPIRTTN